jgi:hypothetical protein
MTFLLNLLIYNYNLKILFYLMADISAIVINKVDEKKLSSKGNEGKIIIN